MWRVLVFLSVFVAFHGFAPALQAQDSGLQVSLIPSGLRAQMVDSKGKQAVWYFLGRRGDAWVAELRGGTGDPIRTEYYNAEGYLVATVHRDGGKETYAPYRCGDRLGKCSYTKTSADGRKQRFVSEVRKTGSTYTVYINGKANTSYRLGIYNIRTMQRQGSYWTKVKRIEN